METEYAPNFNFRFIEFHEEEGIYKFGILSGGRFLYISAEPIR